MLNTSDTLWSWLRSPSAWTIVQRLAIGSFCCIAATILSAQFSALIADFFACGALTLTVAAAAVALWHQVRRKAADARADRENAVVGAKYNRWFWVAFAGMLIGFGWLYLTRLFVIEDPNPEAMECPLAVAFLEQARAARIPADVFWEHDPQILHLKEQDPFYTKGPLDCFKFQWTARVHPFCCLSYLPLVKCIGVNRKVIVCYSTFFAVLAWIGTVLLGWRMFGRWCGLVAGSMMATSLGWLIHVRVGYQHVTPSVALVVWLALTLHSYWVSGSRTALLSAGGLLGLIYLIGWISIAFGVLLTIGVLVFSTAPRFWKTAIHFTCVGTTAVVVALLVGFLYALRYDFPAAKIHAAIREITFGRYKEGEPGLLALSIGQRMAYATKCLFWDSRTQDGHVDKYLEGYPAVPWILTASLVFGLLAAVQTASCQDKLLLLWMLAVFGVLGIIFIYGHRYAMVGLPAMSILAARGVIAVAGSFRAQHLPSYGIAVATLLLLTAWKTNRAYYGRYVLAKEASFEDRWRGQYRFARWLESTGGASGTLVVLSDAVMFPSTAFVFNTYGKGYQWLYWSRVFRPGTSAEEVLAWERNQLNRFRRIVYAFSPTLLGDPQRGQFINDPRPFLAAHPGLQPAWTYSYARRPPLIFVFEVKS